MGRMLRVITFPGGTVPTSDIEWSFDSSGGPGGQHANRSSTRVEASIDLSTAGTIKPKTRDLLLKRLGQRVQVVVGTTRSQARNRDIAIDRLQKRLEDGLATIKPRKPTLPSRAARYRRLDDKRRRSEIKRGRSRINH